MFIAHGEKVRKHSRWILGGILLLLIPSFIAMFTTGSRERRAEGLPTLRGKPVNAVEFETAKQTVRDQSVINTGRQMPRTPEAEEIVTQQAMIQMLLLRKAGELGIRVPDSALLQQIRSQRIFASETGQFNPEAYRRFMIFLNNHGISEERFEHLIRRQMIVGQLQAMVADTAQVTPQEAELTYAPLHEKLWIDLVAFDVTNNTEQVSVSDDDARAAFDQNKEPYRKPAQVKVRYALFAFDEMKKKAKITDAEIQEAYEQGKAHDTNVVAGVTNAVEAAKEQIRQDLLMVSAQRLAGEQAERFSVKLVPEANAPRPDFAKLAAEFGAKVGETGYFSQTDTIEGVKGGRALIQAAFALSFRPEPPFTDPVAGTDGYYVLEYLDGKPSRIPEFGEMKTEVIDRLKRQRLYEAIAKQAREALAKVRQMMGAGQSFAAACAGLKLRSAAHGPFTLSDEKLDLPGAAGIQQATLGMVTNTVSEFIPAASGGVFFYLKDRQPFDRAEFELGKARFTRELLMRNRQAMFESWISTLWRDEQVNLGPRRTRTARPAPEEETEPQPEPAPAPKS